MHALYKLMSIVLPLNKQSLPVWLSGYYEVYVCMNLKKIYNDFSRVVDCQQVFSCKLYAVCSPTDTHTLLLFRSRKSMIHARSLFCVYAQKKKKSDCCAQCKSIIIILDRDIIILRLLQLHATFCFCYCYASTFSLDSQLRFTGRLWTMITLQCVCVETCLLQSHFQNGRVHAGKNAYKPVLLGQKDA